MKNWKTTLASAVTAIAGFVLFSPSHFPAVVIDAAKYVFIGGLAAFGIAAKDSTTHSTTEQVLESSEQQKAKALKI